VKEGNGGLGDHKKNKLYDLPIIAEANIPVGPPKKATGTSLLTVNIWLLTVSSVDTLWLISKRIEDRIFKKKDNNSVSTI